MVLDIEDLRERVVDCIFSWFLFFSIIVWERLGFYVFLCKVKLNFGRTIFNKLVRLYIVKKMEL